MVLITAVDALAWFRYPGATIWATPPIHTSIRNYNITLYTITSYDILYYSIIIHAIINNAHN